MGQSTPVKTFDELFAELTDKAVAAIGTGQYDLVVLNYANPDMVGHTGSLPAAIRACEAVDRGVGAMLAALDAVGGAAVLTTSALAGDPRLRTDATKGLSHGANLLVAAEGLTALRARLSFAESQQKTRILKKNKEQAKPAKAARAVGAAEAGAFALGHFLLVDALTR